MRRRVIDYVGLIRFKDLIDPVILNEVPVQLDMLSVWGIDLDIMVRDLPDPV